MWLTATFLLQAAVVASREQELLHSLLHPEPCSTVPTGPALQGQGAAPYPPGSDTSIQRCLVSLVQPSVGREGTSAACEVPGGAAGCWG